MSAEALTLEEAIRLIEDKAGSGPSKAAPARKAAGTKAPAKKAAPKKAAAKAPAKAKKA